MPGGAEKNSSVSALGGRNLAIQGSLGIPRRPAALHLALWRVMPLGSWGCEAASAAVIRHGGHAVLEKPANHGQITEFEIVWEKTWNSHGNRGLGLEF